eukprot:scaffold312504_cov41-Prasinocladus_malaysianus.AAC.1
MHSRKSQSYRTKESDKFRAGEGMVMFSSDVSARGLDYPGVTQIVQVGMPADRAQYIHRLGRTARGGEGGCGVILLADFEVTRKRCSIIATVDLHAGQCTNIYFDIAAVLNDCHAWGENEQSLNLSSRYMNPLRSGNTTAVK